MNGVERWQSCKWGTPFGWGDREVAEYLAEQGKRENFGCVNPQVISQGNYPVYDVRDQSKGNMILIATLNGSGALADSQVINKLNSTCTTCTQYRKQGLV